MNSPFSPLIIMERKFCILPVFIISIGSTCSGKELLLLSLLPGHLPDLSRFPRSTHTSTLGCPAEDLCSEALGGEMVCVRAAGETTKQSDRRDPS